LLHMFHHVHHLPDGGHEVHHCGGDHTSSDYTIWHCECGMHGIDIEYFKSWTHAWNEHPVVIQFMSRCPRRGWHVESGVEQ